ncbi:hypothetical protein MBLNU13_g10381t2 [Cladosporium sp. NU13]
MSPILDGRACLWKRPVTVWQAAAGHKQMTAYAEKCPNSKIILAGYSQGGQIAGDILGGGGGVSFNGCLQPDTPAMDPESSPGNKIAAIIIFGDTRHVADKSYNWGSGSSIDGYFPRSEKQVANLQAYGDRMRNWCVNTDPICAAKQSTSHDATDHLNYFNVDSQAAASWIKSVASLTDTDSSFTTTVPISRSGTAQDYATVPTATPSGSVTLDTTWTSSTSFAACTASSYPQRTTSPANATIRSSTLSDTASSSASATSKFSSTATSMETSIIPTLEASSTPSEVVSSTDASSFGPASSRAVLLPVIAGNLLCLLAAGAFFGMVLL